MKKLLPPVLVAIITIVMCGARIVLPGPVIVPAPYNWLGLALLVAGPALALIGARRFDKVGTNIKTFNEPTLLVTDGLFKWTRNPMYLGLTLFLLGLAVLLGTLFPFLGPVAFAVTADCWYIPFEEAALQHKFGERYEAYKRATRRWI
ncbi:methyltransferase family protein [Taklimakanibacter deserti]|uniref:methyltransferase family protein n=1 Tax=Taklimakanibacter deserti TaxID=2267839 RepID=UPI000E65ADD6